MKQHREDGFFLPENASKARVREAENARRNRAEMVKAHSQGQVSRRDLIKWGLITTGGLLAPIHGLNPFVKSAYGSIPTGANPSPQLEKTSVVTPCITFGSCVGRASSAMSACVWMSMNPGATTRPAALMT